MPRETDSTKAASLRHGGITAEESWRRKSDDLHSQIETSKKELLELSKNIVPSTQGHSSVKDAIRIAGLLRGQCKEARGGLIAVSDYYQTLKSNWSEIRTRQGVLQELRSTLLRIQGIQSVAQTIDDAMRKGDPGQMSQSCVNFESLIATAPLRMEERFTCLHIVSDRVALAVAESMRMLRSALRNSCLKFDPASYEKCMLDFNNLGASSHFAAHVLQVFEEEATQLLDSALALEAKASQKAISFCSMISSLLAQFTDILRFHRQHPRNEEETQHLQLHRTVAVQYAVSTPPFRLFSTLAARMLSELKLDLLLEQSPTLLVVLDAAKNFSDMAIAGNTLFMSIRSESIADPKASSQMRDSGSEVIRLRRGASRKTVPGAQKDIERKNSGRYARAGDLEQELSKTIRALALDCLSIRHVRHAEELSMITRTPESWIRVKLTEDDLRALFKDVFGGIDGRIIGIPRDFVERREPVEAPDIVILEQLNPASITLTSASLAMLRWVSEYATIGVTVPSILSDAVSNITDIFLILVYSSIDMKSRIQISQSESLLKFVEDLLLERPRNKTIRDFISLASRKSFRIFMDRYGSRETSSSEASYEARKWSSTSGTRLDRYTYALGQLSSDTISCNETIVHQCVAAEGVGTFCEVLSHFCTYMEEIVRRNTIVSEYQGPLQMASLRSAVSVGREVQNAFYGLLAWDIIGGWEAVSAVAETCRSFHRHDNVERQRTATLSSLYVNEMLSRIRAGYSDVTLPPTAAERLSFVICETVMNVVLEGFSRVRYCNHTAAASQMLLDVRTLDLALVEHTGVHPCPGRARTEMYIKATYLDETELVEWADRHRRKLNLSDAHVKALIMGGRSDEIPIVDQIITP